MILWILLSIILWGSLGVFLAAPVATVAVNHEWPDWTVWPGAFLLGPIVFFLFIYMYIVYKLEKPSR